MVIRYNTHCFNPQNLHQSRLNSVRGSFGGVPFVSTALTLFFCPYLYILYATKTNM